MKVAGKILIVSVIHRNRYTRNFISMILIITITTNVSTNIMNNIIMTYYNNSFFFLFGIHLVTTSGIVRNVYI